GDVVGGGDLPAGPGAEAFADAAQLKRAVSGAGGGHIGYSSASRGAAGRRRSSAAGSSAAAAVMTIPAATAIAAIASSRTGRCPANQAAAPSPSPAPASEPMMPMAAPSVT